MKQILKDLALALWVAAQGLGLMWLVMVFPGVIAA